MKKLKSLVFLMLFTFLMSSLFICSASEEHNIDWESLSQRTQISVEELKKSYEMMDYESFISSVEGIENTLNNTLYFNSEKNVEIIPYQMTQYNWERVCNNSIVGSIWITKDFSSIGIDHGHAAIVSRYLNSGDSRIIYTTEHLGKKSGETYSKEYNNSVYDHWRKRNSIRVYEVKGSSSSTSPDKDKMFQAGKYARENLLNRTYVTLASKLSTSVNCATLVYKAYRSQGIYLENPMSGTVIPKDIVNDSDVILKIGFDWPGGSHTW